MTTCTAPRGRSHSSSDGISSSSSCSLLALRNSNFKKNKKKNVKKKNLHPQKKKARLPPRFLENPATISKGSVSCTGNQFYY
jgi:hypothetical protein